MIFQFSLKTTSARATAKGDLRFEAQSAPTPNGAMNGVKDEPECPAKTHTDPLECVLCDDSGHGQEFLACGTCRSLVHGECLERNKAFLNAQKSECFTCRGEWVPQKKTRRAPVIDIEAEQYELLLQLRARSRS
jgi:hypothetical protein